MIKTREQARATAEMALAATLWGFGFIATVWALDKLSALELIFVRFLIATAFGAAIIAFMKRNGAWREYFTISFWPAIFLLGTLVFQTWGLYYTSVAKSGFITTLYVVFVPLLESVLSRRNLSRMVWACVALALFGTGLIVGAGFSDFNLGDALTLVSALFATAQIYLLGSVSPRVKEPFIFNVVQSAWCAAICAPVIFFLPTLTKLTNVGQWPTRAWVGVLALAFGSTILAFYLQVKAQARLSPTLSSLLFLLESPAALIFAILFLSQGLGLREAIGAALIFLSAIGASLFERDRKKY